MMRTLEKRNKCHHLHLIDKDIIFWMSEFAVSWILLHDKRSDTIDAKEQNCPKIMWDFSTQISVCYLCPTELCIDDDILLLLLSTADLLSILYWIVVTCEVLQSPVHLREYVPFAMSCMQIDWMKEVFIRLCDFCQVLLPIASLDQDRQERADLAFSVILSRYSR